jgi:hypothetical protein
VLRIRKIAVVRTVVITSVAGVWIAGAECVGMAERSVAVKRPQSVAMAGTAVAAPVVAAPMRGVWQKKVK